MGYVQMTLNIVIRITLLQRINYESATPYNLTVPPSLSLSFSSHAYANKYLFGCHAKVNVGPPHGASVIFSPVK